MEQLSPGLTRHRYCTHRLSNDAGEGVCKVVRRYSAGPFQLDYACASPGLTNEFSGQAPNVLCRDHWECLVCRLQEAVNEAGIARRDNVPSCIIDEPSGSQDRKRDLKLTKRLFHHSSLRQ